jgi:hypothetical protein
MQPGRAKANWREPRSCLGPTGLLASQQHKCMTPMHPRLYFKTWPRFHPINWSLSMSFPNTRELHKSTWEAWYLIGGHLASFLGRVIKSWFSAQHVYSTHTTISGVENSVQVLSWQLTLSLINLVCKAQGDLETLPCVARVFTNDNAANYAFVNVTLPEIWDSSVIMKPLTRLLKNPDRQ